MDVKQKKNLMVFGYGLSLILFFLGSRIWIKHAALWPTVLFLILAVGLAVLTTFDLQLVKKIYNVWMAVAHKIGLGVTTVILMVIFYLVFGVVGILLRIMRKDLLNRNIDPGQRSYWIKRKQGLVNPESYLKQYC